MPSKTEAARLVFEGWKAATNHPRSNLDSKRRTLIIARLNDGYSEEDLTMAALGISVSPFHQGQNADHRIYDSCELCFRNSDKVDYFVRAAEEHIARQKAAEAHSEKVAQAAIQKSTSGEIYRENRGALLKLVRRQ